LTYSFRYSILCKIIASVIILSFRPMIWRGRILLKITIILPVTGLQTKEVLARLKAGLIIELIEKQSVLSDRLADLSLSDILKWQKSSESQFDALSLIQ